MRTRTSLRYISAFFVAIAVLVFWAVMCLSCGGGNSNSPLSPGSIGSLALVAVGHTTSGNFPVSSNALQATSSGNQQSGILTVLAVGSGSTSLAYSTYIGSGSAGTQVRDVWIDPSGNIYIGGTTSDPGLPTTPGVFQRAYAGGPDDAFIGKLDPNGNLVWLSYLGTNGTTIEEKVYGICGYDASGNLLIAGRMNRASSYGWGGAPNIIGSPTTNMTHVFAAKIKADGTSVLWSDIIGGTGANGEGNRGRCALDSSGNLIGEGETSSADFPTTAGSYQPTKRSAVGISQGVVYKVASSNGAMMWATYIGGTGSVTGQGTTTDGGVAVDAANNVYVTGFTYSTDLPNTGAPAGGVQPTFLAPAGDAECYVMKLAADGSSLLNWTYWGGSTQVGTGGFSECMGLNLDSSGNVWVQGLMPYSNMPTSAGAYQATNKGPNMDGFLTKFSANLSTMLASTYIGGNGNETGDSSARIEFDSSGNVWTGLTTNSANFPVTSNAFQRSFQGGADDEVIAGFTSDLKSLVYGSYLGGSGTDFNRSFRLK